MHRMRHERRVLRSVSPLFGEPRLETGMTFKWSFSSLMLFEQCGFKYAAQYLPQRLADALRVPIETVPKRTQHPAAARGDMLHKQIDVYLKTHVEGVLSPELHYWLPALRDIRRYPHWSEHRIAILRDWTVTQWDNSNVWARGILDLKAQKPDALCMYDWKTGKEYDEHFAQKEFYALLLWSEHPDAPKIRTAHIYLDSKDMVPREYLHSTLSYRREQWALRAGKLETAVQGTNLLENFPMTPNKFCKWCELRRSAGGPCKFA